MAGPLFAKVSQELDFPQEERAILHFWKDRDIFRKTLTRPAPRGPFVFYEGPPTANGLPHNGHVLTRVIKDLFPRYKTMRGFSVPRKAGWDTHGLPVEVEVEKELRLHGKAAILDYGVEPFVKKCIDSVFRYTKEWENLTERVAFWVDLRDAYVTYHRTYVESVWWALGELFEKGLLYQGHKVVWWWAQGGTALSSGEVGQGYRSVDDPSVYVAFPLKGEDNLALLVWTTTPWTLPSNMYAAVHPDLDYVVARTPEGRRIVIAERLVDALSKKIGVLEVERRLAGRDLEGRAYEPPFDLFAEFNSERRAAAPARAEPLLWRVVLAPFVTLDAGTGVVHIAPAFGEDDHELYRRELDRSAAPPGGPRPPLLCAVKPDGTFIGEVSLPDGRTKTVLDRYAGRWVKDCDKEIQHDLKDRGLLVHAEQYRHDYPFCWRADTDPLIQYARPAWYIRTTAHIDRAIANNRAIDWMPDHIKEGRFGDFLAHNVDWALSRERWWGTPLNVWVCENDPEHKDALTSVAEIEKRNPAAFDHFRAACRADPSLNEHLIVHKPWIDQVTVPCKRCSGTMRRVTEVVDCWFDSGCMPFAQWGYPVVPGSVDKFEASFPADFISEAIDQTRGWFYSLLMVSTLVFGERSYPHPFKTCIVLGHVTDKEGKKESKSKGNYTPPEIILDKVAMDFAVVEDGDASQGSALVAREDLDGLDLKDGASVRVHRDDSTASLDVVLRVGKNVRRRSLALHATDRAKIGVIPVSAPAISPLAVGRLPREERVVLEDPSTPAPGADAFRWFFYASSPPWSSTRHSLANVRALQKEFAVKLRNVYSFFTIYGNIDGFDPYRVEPMPVAARPELDRWILSELALTVRDVTVALDAYDVFGATQKLTLLVDALSNWWVRRSRARFWRSGWDEDKRSAHETLHQALVTVAKLVAPFTPYAAESMWQNLAVGPSARLGSPVAESVHLADWPEADEASIDERLSRKLATVRALVSLGLQVRTQAKIKVRQPVRAAHVITIYGQEIDGSARVQLMEELNVVRDIEVVRVDDAERYVEFVVKPSFRSLGQRGLGKEAQALKKKMGALSSREAGELAAKVMAGGSVRFDGIELRREDVDVEFKAREGFAAAGDRVGVVVLDTTLDDELRDLGLVRELLNRIQVMRKELGLEYTDRIDLAIVGSERLTMLVERHMDALAKEVLALSISTASLAASAPSRRVDVDGEVFHLEMALAADVRGGRLGLSRTSKEH
ncbi:MAG: isoleucine--tRNA ligase [Polyangiaceae bacterium]|jgi:isoleucyl-tRNA synthetase